jgi:predicted RND superfamily exporter protein
MASEPLSPRNSARGIADTGRERIAADVSTRVQLRSFVPALSLPSRSVSVPSSARLRAHALVACTLVGAALAAWYGRGLETDNRIESWAEAVGADPAYDVLVDRFGGDFLVLARAEEFDLADPRDAEWLDGLHARLGALPGAARVIDGLHLIGLRGKSVEERLVEFETRPLARAIDLGGANAGRLDAFVVLASTAGPEESLGFDAGFRVLREEAEALGITLQAAGHPFVAAALDRESKSVDRFFAPLLVIAGFLVCAAFLRSPRLALVALLPGVLGALGVRAGLRLVGVPSNMILVAAGPLVFVVMVASMVHLAGAWRRHVLAGADPESAAHRARRDTWRPAAVAAATTVAGFAVFLTSEVGPVRELGATVALSVALLVPLSYAAMPIALAGLPSSAVSARVKRARRGPWRRVAVASLRARPWALVATLALLVLGALAPRHMPVALSAIEYFPVGHPIREEYFALDSTSAGLGNLEVLVRSYEPLDPKAARDLSAALGHCDRVGAVFGPPTISADLSSLGPLALALLPAALVETGRRGRDGEWWRFTARASANTPEEIARFDTSVRRAVADWAAATGYEAHVTGSILRLFAMQEALVGTLARSLGLTALVALLSFALCLRGPRQVATAVVANLVPIAAVLAGARALGYALDAATVMVASAVVGLALDNTFHLMLAGGAGGRATRVSALRSFDRVGGPAVAGITILAVGFGCLALADFQPTARFGTLAALGLLGALFADLVVIPALWIQAGARPVERGESLPACSTAS